MPSCLLIANPAAGRCRPEASPDRLLAALRERGLETELCCTDQRGDAETAARDAASRGCELVVAAGGDGTVNEAVNGLMGTDTRLAILPCGTANVFAMELGLPTDLARACEIAAGAGERRVDVGVANGRAFVMSAGVGFDAGIIRSVSLGLKRRVGKGAYYVAALRAAISASPATYDLRIDGERRRERLAGLVVCNTSLYAGRYILSPQARPDDGLLDLCLLHAHSRLALLRTLLMLVTHRAHLCPSITVQPIRRLEVFADPSVPVHLDGDDFANTPITVEVKEKRLTVRVESTDEA